MKKLTALSAAAAILAAPLVLAAPSSAGSDKVSICHATSAANGHYNLIEVDKNSITKQGHGSHERDIIPAFSWVEDKVRHYFDGLNTDKLDLLANGCKAPAEPVTATVNPPVYVPASCARPELPYGEVIIPKDLGEGVAGATSAMSDEPVKFSVAYSLVAPTEERVYSWPAGVTGQWEFDAVPITADPAYVVDSRTGEGKCELPETGASDYLLPGGIALGLLALGGTAMAVSRRRSA